MIDLWKTYTVRLLALVTVPRRCSLAWPLHGAEELLLPIWEGRVTLAHLRGKSCLFKQALQEIHKGLSVLASEVTWRISVTHTTKEMLYPSVINHDAHAAPRRFWNRNLQVLTKKRERSLGDEVCWFFSVFFKLREKKERNYRLLREQRIPEKFLILMQKTSSH